jgi:hypothetical protein
MASSKQMKTSKTRDFQKEPMNSLETEIAVTALHATEEFSVLRKLAWWISVPSTLENDELSWLASEIYFNGTTDRVEISRINALDRFSVREK